MKGEIEDVRTDPEDDESRIYIKISRLYRQISRVFVRQDLPEGSMQDGHLATRAPQSPLRGVLVSSGKCGISKGKGQFLFLGKIRLGRAILHCAPRAEFFHQLWEGAVKNNNNPCVMS